MANTNISFSNLCDNPITLCTSSNICLFSSMPNSVSPYSKTATVTPEISEILFASLI